MKTQTLKEKWIAALRSGKYKQGQMCLRNVDPNEFCCLGVLCDIVDPNGWGDQTEDGKWCFQRSRRSEEELDDEADWGYAPRYILSKEQNLDLSRLNDSKNLTFEQIADYLENHPEIDPKAA